MSTNHTPETIKLRGHHLLCSIGFRGKGYSSEFVRNMAQVVGVMRSNHNVRIEVGWRHDEICASCPSLGPNGCSKKGAVSEFRVGYHDMMVIKRLGIKNGETVVWSDVMERIKQNVRPEDLSTLCRGCQWLPLGYCEEGLRQLRAKGDAPQSNSKAK